MMEDKLEMWFNLIELSLVMIALGLLIAGWLDKPES